MYLRTFFTTRFFLNFISIFTLSSLSRSQLSCSRYDGIRLLTPGGLPCHSMSPGLAVLYPTTVILFVYQFWVILPRLSPKFSHKIAVSAGNNEQRRGNGDCKHKCWTCEGFWFQRVVSQKVMNQFVFGSRRKVALGPTCSFVDFKSGIGRALEMYAHLNRWLSDWINRTGFWF